MKQLKHILMTAAALTLSVLLFSGCSNNEQPSNNTTAQVSGGNSSLSKGDSTLAPSDSAKSDSAVTINNEASNTSNNEVTGTAKGYEKITVTLTISDGIITNSQLDASGETPEIGGKAVDEYFSSVITDLSGQSVRSIDPNTIDTCSGATLTSNGVKNALAAALAQANGDTFVKNALTAGTYTYSANGYGGEMIVDCILSEDAIVAVNVTENNETYGVGTTAIELLTQTIIREQSSGVDAIAGATLTSAGVLSAVNQALTAAGADMAAWSAGSVPDLSQEAPVSMSTDVIVVGGGGAGLSAALAALSSNADVIVLEKADILGGNTALSEGNCLITGSNYEKKIAQEQIAAGNTDYENTLSDSPEKAYEDIMITGHFLSRPDTLRTFVNNCGPAWDFIIDNTEFNAYSSALKGAVVPGKVTTLRSYAPSIGRGTEITVPLETAIRKYDNAQILTRTEGYELIYDEANNTVTGIKARNNQNGQEYVISAEKGIILATGMMSGKVAKEYQVLGVYNRGKQYNTGDGQKMAIDIGADTWLLDLSCRGGRMVTDNFEYADGLGVSLLGLSDLFANGGAIAVEAHGRRFLDENKILGNNEAISNLKDKCYYAVMDEPSFQNYLYSHNGESSNNYNTWLANNNCDAGGIAQGASLEEAAEKAGIDAGYLNASVQYYNYCTENDIADTYGRENRTPLAEGSYYIIRLQPAFNTTSGGLLVNENCAVLHQDGEPIHGLYAAGNCAGGANGSIYYMGCSVGWSMTSGFLAGQSVVAQ